MRFLAVDFGSTYTKLTAIEARSPADARIVGGSAAFTTVATDVMEGFAEAKRCLDEAIGPFDHDRMLCCSSAAGGLAMIAVGLVPELTAKAARMAAESAGAKVLKTYAYELSSDELEEIRSLRPDIILLCGGTDGGNKNVILANARQLATLGGHFSLIIAGNKSAAGEVRAILDASGKRYVITKNVMPVFGALDIEPARSCIRDIFIERIIDAKGLAKAQAMTDLPIIPTPLAVLNACELLSLGTHAVPGIGEFLAVDLGGATTDVYSLAKGAPERDNVLIKGLPEPFTKRTVEGDLGMRYSAGFLLDAVGAERVALGCGAKTGEVEEWVCRCMEYPETVAPQNSVERAVDEALARFAIAEAVTRHCGRLERSWTPMGELYTLTGKDLTGIRRVLGIGGALKSSANPAAILEGARGDALSLAAGIMLPVQPEYFLDSKYICSAMGVLAQVEPDMALSILKKEIQLLPEGNHGIEE